MQERLRQLESATSALITDVSLDGVLHHVVQVAAEVMEARYAASGVVGPGGRCWRASRRMGSTQSSRAASDPRRVATAFSASSRHSRGEADPPNGFLTRHSDSHGLPAHRPPMRSLLGVPLGGRRGVLGNLYLTEKNGGESFTDEDEDLAILLAAKARRRLRTRAITKRARLLEEVQQLQRRPSGSSRW